MPDVHLVHVGPRLNFQTAWSANAVAVCHACAIFAVHRIELSRRYQLCFATHDADAPSQQHVTRMVAAFRAAVHDRMTEMEYPPRLTSFQLALHPPAPFRVDVLQRGEHALRHINRTDGLAFDDADIAYYTAMFRRLRRNPTNVELYDLAQSNSEHSRHWFFNAHLVIDNHPAPHSLLHIVRQPLRLNRANSVIAFADNSSTIRATHVPLLTPSRPGSPSALCVRPVDTDVLFTAETHNFPSGVAPFPGAETGTGGRIRDTAATGTGSLLGVATAGYAVGNLYIPHCAHPWESPAFRYPTNLASPLQILIQASNGASDYGNKFGEPVVSGFARSYALRMPDGLRREYVKPIMFSGAMGQMHHQHATKGAPTVGLLVIKVGGPAYRIGMGGGAASSMMQGDNAADLDFNAVQRGDAEMAQKVYRVLRACVEMGQKNPIVSIHDQGAGGNCNVVKELIYPAGAKIHVRNVLVGDATLSALEIWVAEYQEQFGLLLRPEHEPLFRTLCDRENVVPTVLGTIDGSGRIVLWDELQREAVVDMDLHAVLGDLPQKTFTDSRVVLCAQRLQLPPSTSVESALRRVLSLMGVGSKRFLTTKVDRSVTGLVAQQQCVGALQLPLCDYAVSAQSHFSLRGSATAIGERPTLTALSPQAMARMSVGEMMTNLCGAKLTSRMHIKCEANWMWAAKLPGDCASLYDAAVAMSDVMVQLGIAVDGGKDSLSMAARCPTDNDDDAPATEMVRAPGTLVVSGYCTMENVERKLTPDIKAPGDSALVHIDIASGRRRLGGSALAQVYSQLGQTPPDMLDGGSLLANAFDAVQELIDHEAVLSCHDVSDGGLITALLEMAFGGNCGLDVAVDSESLGCDTVAALFAEELGIVIEVRHGFEAELCEQIAAREVPYHIVGHSRSDNEVHITDGGNEVLAGDIRDYRDAWEHTSFALERQQANTECVDAEQENLRRKLGPTYVVPYTPRPTAQHVLERKNKPKVAIIREEGSNGDREMSAAFHMSGFECWDVCMRDISSGAIGLSQFNGVAFVGGFSYADVLDSAKGWAAVIRYNERVRDEFEAFYSRTDTFSLGVCNGCQLMALLGRVPFAPQEVEENCQPRFIHNKSGRYESRFSTVRIADECGAVMLRGMGSAQLGVWVAHGEGRAYFASQQVLEEVERMNLVALRYVDDDGEATMTYPENPNGSMHAIAGLCSRDGRHLAMMPHPERTVLKWQWAYAPGGIEQLEASPWLRMFQNAHEWVVNERAV
eukprot:gb/GEZJ01003686.1/.p1 GENE.gb/GEZJ01003686.1/~~gb/GEZJ01003686.1/.p1  ORF type:complete len:1455 (-),score=231.88 gb/GEZJ01003686.1/:2637-6386(-)